MFRSRGKETKNCSGQIARNTQATAWGVYDGFDRSYLNIYTSIRVTVQHDSESLR